MILFFIFTREEDEYEESDTGQSNRSEVSANDNNANDSQTASIGKYTLYLLLISFLKYSSCYH